MSFETKLEKYARLIVQSGLNVQEKQTVVISASIESYQLVREVTKQAYLVGAKEVVVHYSDEEVTRMKYENMEVEDFNHVPTWFSSFRNDYALMNACFLYVDDEDPEMLAGIEPKKISNWQRAVKKACKTYFDLSDNMTNAWCIVGGATQKWANKVYPDMSNQEALDSLWNAIFKAAKIDDEHDPVELWNQHRRSFEKRVNYLNSLNLKKLYYKNSKGTEITIGLNDDYLFAGGGSYLKNGVYNFPNIPTEEIFTSPNKDDVEGIVFSSLPLSYGGNIVDEFYLRFKDGQVIDFGAKEGYEVLKGIIDSDEGSKHLGEVALIPYHSPINELKTLFYNTLYDENASCHMALGIGFSECIKGGIDMDKKELFEKGVNDSLVHVKLMKQETEKVLKRLGLDLDPGTPVSELSVGLCQMVEIAKAVSKNASILVFDEPSAALSDSETEFLFKMIRQLKEEGVSMVYISHRMNEILEICDRVTVIRDGKKVITEKVENLTMEEIVAQMMGNEAKETKFEYVPREYDRNAEDLLTVKHLKINDKIDDINFSIKPGQILGLAGLMGAGRTEIMETLFGLRKAVSGSIELEGKKVEIKNPSDAVACGFALVPEDRRKEGLVLSHTIKENAILPISAQLVKNGIFNDDKAAHDIVEKNIQDLGVVADNMNQEIRLLSGGNQQKIVIAKWLNSNPKIFMFDEPTAGVDIVAKGEIISIIREFADKGGAVIFASSELAEMMAICDDIITIFDGKITGRIGRKELMKEEELQHAIQRK